MGQRLTRIVTKKGDRGFTSLADGSRVDKNSPRIEMLGTVDELNSWIGAVASSSKNESIRTKLYVIQNGLFDLGAGISTPSAAILSDDHVNDLDTIFEELHSSLPPQKEFILPGGSMTAAFAHVARSVCRRAEREFLSLQDVDPQPSEHALAYLNRLSDVLFEVARLTNQSLGIREANWTPRIGRS